MKENQKESNVNLNRKVDDQNSRKDENRKPESSLRNSEKDKDIEREGEGTKMPGRETKTPVAGSQKNIDREEQFVFR